MKLAMERTHRIRSTGESPLFVSPVSWNKENVLALLPLIDCEQCGDCCRTVKRIVVKDDELLRIADYLDVKASDLRRQWTRDDQRGAWLLPDQPCTFLKDGRCSIHPARMVVCKYYPLQRINYHGVECIGISAYCDSGKRCIEWLEKRVNDRIIH